MICVEVHSNNVLTVRDMAFSNAVSDSVKHETVKFLFCDSWKKYQKTVVFSAEGVEPINVLLDVDNPMCLSEQECYVPFEVLKGTEFSLSVFGVLGESLATTTSEKIKVLESGYALGEAPKDPTPSEYEQILRVVNEIKQVANSVRTDADNGLFKGDKGDKGDKGEKGDAYNLTEQDRNIIALNVLETEFVRNVNDALEDIIATQEMILGGVSQ